MGIARELLRHQMSDKITINRAPVLTLWAAVVAERLGFDRAFALTLGQAVAGPCLRQGRVARYHSPGLTWSASAASGWAKAKGWSWTCSAGPSLWCERRTAYGP